MPGFDALEGGLAGPCHACFVLLDVTLEFVGELVTFCGLDGFTVLGIFPGIVVLVVPPCLAIAALVVD